MELTTIFYHTDEFCKRFEIIATAPANKVYIFLLKAQFKWHKKGQKGDHWVIKLS